MTTYSLHLKAKNELTPHPTAQYWRKCQVEELFDLPFMDLVFRAASIHRENFDPNAIQLSTLLSIKTGGCAEDCEYCPQSARYDTGVEKQTMLNVDYIVEKAQIAKARGASRFCMGAAWRGPKPKDIETVSGIIKAVKSLGLETCGTFGMLEDGMAEDLKEAGLDYYNHNLDTDPERYNKIVHTRSHDDRMDTLGKVRHAGLKICCGGIVGMNETRAERAGLIASLANLDPQPESVPINQLVKMPKISIGQNLCVLLPLRVLPCHTAMFAYLQVAAICQNLCKRFVLWRERIRFSMVTNCLPPKTQKKMATVC